MCRWTEERWHKLQEVLLVWQQLLEDQVHTHTNAHTHALTHSDDVLMMMMMMMD